MRDRLDVSALRACVIAVVLATSFAFLFVAPSHDPSPNDLPVAVVGPTAATAPFVGALEQREGQFHVVRLVDAKAGRDAVLDRDVYGTFIVTRPKAPELLVATA